MSELESSGQAPTGDTSDSVERFAADLRKLRLGAGSPTFKRLQTQTGVSRTVLSEALAGRQLPSPRTLEGIVRACGGASDAWLDRRDALADRDRVSSAASATASRRGHAVSRRAAILLAAVAFVVGIAASAVVTTVIVRGLPSQPSQAPLTAVTTGENPAATPCLDDAAVATSETGAENSLLEILWSDTCQAGWGRITRYDGLGEGNTVTVAIYPEPAPLGPDRQEVTEHDVQGAYTNLVVRPSPDTLLCAEGSISVDGESIDFGEPLCI